MLGEVSVHDGLDIIGAVGDDTVNAVFEHLDYILFLVNCPCVDLHTGGMGALDKRLCGKRLVRMHCVAADLLHKVQRLEEPSSDYLSVNRIEIRRLALGLVLLRLNKHLIVEARNEELVEKSVCLGGVYRLADNVCAVGLAGLYLDVHDAELIALLHALEVFFDGRQSDAGEVLGELAAEVELADILKHIAADSAGAVGHLVNGVVMADNYISVFCGMDVGLGSVGSELDRFFKRGDRVLRGIAVSTAVCDYLWLIQHCSPLKNF